MNSRLKYWVNRVRYIASWRDIQAFLAQQRVEKIRQFKNSRDVTPLPIENYHLFGGVSVDYYEKKLIHLRRKDEMLDIITNQNIHHDTTALWRTTGECVRLALRMGQLNPQALTAQVIKAVGQYRKIEAERAIKSNIMSHLAEEKTFLVDFAQDRVEKLQELERFLGHRVYPENAQYVIDKIIQAIISYMRQQKMMERSFHKRYLAAGFPAGELKAYFVDEHAAALNLKKLVLKYKNNPTWLQAYGYDEIASFIKERCKVICEQTRGLNQILTHKRVSADQQVRDLNRQSIDKEKSGAFFRGDLHSVLVDGSKVVDDYVQDPHNPVTYNHQLIYGNDEKIIVDSDYHTDGSQHALDDMMLCISKISGSNDTSAIRRTSATKWGNTGGQRNPYQLPLFRGLGHLFGVVVWNMVLAPLKLIETVIRGNDASWIARCENVPEESSFTQREIQDQTNYYALLSHIKKSSSLSTRVGLAIHRALKYFIWEGVILGAYDGIMQFSRMPAEVAADFKKQNIPTDCLLVELHRELQQIKEKEQKIIKELFPDDGRNAELAAKLEAQSVANRDAASVPYAQPDVPLAAYHSPGVLNSIGDGIINAINFYGHNVFAKQPFTGLVGVGFAAASFLAFFNVSAAYTLLNKGYVQFLRDQGFLWTSDPFAAAMAGSQMNFQLMSAFMDGIENGPDSWIGKGVGMSFKEPEKLITYITLSWLIGHAMLYQMNIGGVQEHIGTIPQFAEIGSGAKAGFLAYRLLLDPQESALSLRKNYISECMKIYHKLQKQRGNEVQLAEENKFKGFITDLLAQENVTAIHERIKRVLEKITVPQQQNLTLMLNLAVNKQYLMHLSPLLKAKLAHTLPKLTVCNADASAIVKYLDPEKYTPRSTLRSFLGRVVSYVPLTLRCLMSPLSLLWSRSLASAWRPWKLMGELLLDDITSTTHAVFNLVNKVFETVFNRIPRTVVDIVLNSIVARTASYFGNHRVTLSSYQCSADWEVLQNRVYRNTTGYLQNALARANTTPHPEIGLQNGLEANIIPVMPALVPDVVDRVSPISLRVSPIPQEKGEPRLRVR